MRYAKILSWTLFVAVFLAYLAAISWVRGDQVQPQPQPQQYVLNQRYPAAQPAHIYHPFTGQTYQTGEPVALYKQARVLSDYVTFSDPQVFSGQQQTQQTIHLPPSVDTQSQLSQLQSISRRQHLPQASQTSPLHALHPFVPPTSSSLSSPGKV